MNTPKGNEIINFYAHKDIKKHLTTYHNPHFDDTQISIPCRIGVIASSGSGKTQWLLNYLARSNDTFGHIIIVYKAVEALYQFLEDKIGGKHITFYTKLSDLPSPKELQKEYHDKQVLIVFDDQINESEQAHQIVKELCIRGRKMCRSISIIYLAQSFFRIPKIVRQQFNYLVILKLSSNRDLQLILGDFSLGLDKMELMKVYKDATRDKFNFLKIDLDNPNDNNKFSKNWTGFYKLSDEDSD